MPVIAMLKKLLILVLGAVLMTGVSAQAEPTALERETLVRQFIDAFNRHDSDAMMSMMAPQIQWLNISGDTITAEGSSREAIGKSMRAYFKSCPTCRSQLTGVVATAHRLSAVELAQWQGQSGSREQRSVSVYEFSGPLISRVYYFPAEK